MTDVIWIGYTTRYRGGSTEFAIAADTMRRASMIRYPGREVRVAALDGKADFTAAMDRIVLAGDHLEALHFIGHAGMYGPMFSSTAWPEQFSPHEWRSMRLPFRPGAHAYFHTCRSARWFAPFFANTFYVPTSGHRGYTTVSARPDEFSWAKTNFRRQRDLYLIETVGRKTHGLIGSARKYLGAPAIPMVTSVPTEQSGHAAYDRVAALYDAAYSDIRVRESEWHWMHDHLRAAYARRRGGLCVIDIGCGNGSLLQAIDEAGLLRSATGFDVSPSILAAARARNRRPAIQFLQSNSPILPLPDQSVDVAISFLSFRYLDWDPVMVEIRRVLAPGGRLLVVDMVERRATLRDTRRLAKAAFAHRRTSRRHPQFVANLRALTSHPEWQDMLQHNPIRAEHEYRWYLQSRFPGARLETLTATPHHRVVALDTGPLTTAEHVAMSYP
jgi:ubiquinone/menaquinone biosynthesis C-methylase UbiE